MSRFLVLLSFWPLVTFASDVCPTIDLTKNTVLSTRKHLDQGDMGWCCSYAFVDAIALKTGKVYSPIDIAISQAKRSGTKDGCADLADVAKAINESAGLCAENQYRQMTSLMDAVSPNDLWILMEHKDYTGKINDVPPLDKAGERYMNKESHNYAITNLWQMFESMKMIPVFREIECNSKSDLSSPLFIHIKTTREVAEIAMKDLDKKFTDFLYDVGLKNCPQRDKVKIEYEEIPLKKKKDAYGKEEVDTFGATQKIIQLLKENKSPVFRYDVSGKVFKHEESQKIPVHLVGYLKKFFGKDTHAVNVVGTEAIGRKCYLKIRDSTFGFLGAECEALALKGVVCPAPGSKDGTFQVDADVFLKTATQELVIK